ncbi:MAG: hypothetical protein AAGU74_08390 [Bacillota bacterium]
MPNTDRAGGIVKKMRESALVLQSYAVEPEMTYGCQMDDAADLIESMQAQIAEYEHEIKTYQVTIMPDLREQLAASQRRERAAEGCETCVHHDTDSYRYYTYPCSECKHRARDSYEPIERGPRAGKGEAE